jgi:two-component system alkaline phosphatase synthesis response regulator PhoP
MNDTLTILVADDAPTIVETLAYMFRREGYRVLTAADGAAALRLAYADHPDLIILDLMLPGLNGYEVCRVLRRDFQMPILILSARTEEADKIHGLDLGADGYLTKPFSLRELLARTRALLRRSGAEPGSSSPAPIPPPDPARQPLPAIQVGNLTIHLAGRVVQRDGTPLTLKPKEFDLLAFLATHPHQTFTREALLDNVWGYDYFGGTRTVDVHVRWLRTKVEHDPADPRLIQTIYRVGYKFVPAAIPPSP